MLDGSWYESLGGCGSCMVFTSCAALGCWYHVLDITLNDCGLVTPTLGRVYQASDVYAVMHVGRV